VGAGAAHKLYTEEDLLTDLSVVQVTAQLGFVGSMLEALLNATYGLADTNFDGSICVTEAKAFAVEHLKDGTPLAETLGLRGGMLSLNDEAKVSSVVAQIFSKCDTNEDGHISRDEATKCRRYLYELFATIPPPSPPPLEQPPNAAGRDGVASGWDELMASLSRGPSTKARHQRSAVSLLAPLLTPLRRRSARLAQRIARNVCKPNFNTFLGAIGLGSLLLREALVLDVLALQERFKGLIGGQLHEFLKRLLLVSIAAMLAAAFGNFDGH